MQQQDTTRRMTKQQDTDRRSLPLGLIAIYLLGFLLIALNLKNYLL